MFCVEIVNPGLQSTLSLSETPIPEYSAKQLLVRVKSAALNRADLLQRQGKYPPPQGGSAIPGLEIAGDIVALGKAVSDFKIGDRIMALVNGGAYAEYCLVEPVLAAKIPDSWAYTFATAIPEALMTVHATLFEIGNLYQGQTLLVHGAGSGIGSLTIQMAKHAGAKVITTVGHPSKIPQAFALGAEQVIDYRKDDFRKLLATESIDRILDFIGGDYLNKHLELLKPLGKLIQIACMKGAKAECNLALLLKKRLQMTGFILRSQSLEEKSVLWESALRRWFPLFLNQEIAPIIDSEFGFRDVEKAHLRMQTGEHFGKIVIVMKG